MNKPGEKHIFEGDRKGFPGILDAGSVQNTLIS